MRTYTSVLLAALHRIRRTTRIWPLIALLLATQGVPARAAQPQKTEAQWWKGRVTLPGITLDFVVVFRPVDEAGQYSARIDIPVQGAKDLALVDVTLTQSEICFTLPPPPGAPPAAKAVFTAQRAADGRSATGELKQHGQTFPLRMERISEAEAQTVGPERPQTPKPPFPYKQRDVTYENPKDGTKLAGTLTIPEGGGRHPAVILITGSGPQDRDETIFGHKPFLVLADHLTRHGIAVLRVDDRGVGGSTGRVSEATSRDLAGDVLVGVEFLAKQPELDPNRIGLIGHSEGGLIAPLVAAESKRVACIVLLSGSGLPGSDILSMQLQAILRAAGRTEAQVADQLKAQRQVLERAASDAGEGEILQALRELVRIQLSQAEPTSAPAEEQIGALAEQALKGMRSPWMRFFLRLDPRESLRLVKCPVLALGGSLDLQVPPKENLPEIEKALRAGGNDNVTVKELPGLNHLFQEAQTGLVAEYAMIPQTIAPLVLDEVASWLRMQFRLE